MSDNTNRFAMVPEPLVRAFAWMPDSHVRILQALLVFGPGEMFPSQSLLALYTGLSAESGTIKKALQEMVEAGILTCRKRWDKLGDRASNVYTLNPIADGEVTYLSQWYGERYPKTPGAMRDIRGGVKAKAPGPKSIKHSDANVHGPIPDEAAQELAEPPRGCPCRLH